MSLEEAWDKLRQRAHQPLTEVHVVNGLHPELPFDYYLELLRGFKRIRPGIHLKCFTAVEIAFFADLYGMTDEQVLLDAQGGRARFAARRRRRECSPSGSGRRSATTSAAPIATSTSIASHTASACARTSPCSTATSRPPPSASITCCARARCRTRPAGSRRSSRSRSIPTTTRCGSFRRRRAADTLRVHAVARLMLDNIPHVKAFWIATGVEVAQMALWFGVDDLDGTVQEERIYHMAGARTPESMTHVRHPPAHPRRRPRARRAGHALQRGNGTRRAGRCAHRSATIVGSRQSGVGSRSRQSMRVGNRLDWASWSAP